MVEVHNGLLVNIKKKAAIEKKIDEWIDRLNMLYQQVEEWLRDIPNLKVEVERINVLQREEKMMKDYNIKPRYIQNLKIKTEKDYIAFYPVALWVLGADGRVDVDTKDRHLILLDVRQKGRTNSDWKITGVKDQKILVPFNKDFLLDLLDDIS
ncbi:MAG: hypothetical protein L3V56_06565 [Candidatus Magnetoovum sp. WYHC-5]|nr:hypothetical protein [Candidatus Magnetoovum sp. WYHC-5]